MINESMLIGVERAWLKVSFNSKCQVDVKYNTLLLFKDHNQDCRAKLSTFLSGDNRALSWFEREICFETG